MSDDGDLRVEHICERCGLHYTETLSRPASKHWGWCPRCAHRPAPKVTP